MELLRCLSHDGVKALLESDIVGKSFLEEAPFRLTRQLHFRSMLTYYRIRAWILGLGASVLHVCLKHQSFLRFHLGFFSSQFAVR